jgi:DNA-binding NtrC family response regulator
MNILIITDDKSTKRVLEKELTDLYHHVIFVSDAFEGVALLAKTTFELAICDIQTPSVTRISLPSLTMEFIRSKTPLVLLSSLKDDDLQVETARLGAVEFLMKPVDFRKLAEIIDRYH